jgi:hypothetical protein
VLALILALLLGPGDDDPGIAQALGELDEPFPDAPPLDDPGISEVAPPPRASEAQGIKLRLGYKTFTLVETTRDGDTSQRFHVVTLDFYPITWYVRVGLTTQVAFETDSPNHDWLATEGLMVGLQRPGSFAPFVDGGVHVGLGRRSFYVPEIDHEFNTLTVLWAYFGEAGVDFKVAGGAKGTVALGLQRTSYFSNGDQMTPIATVTDTALTLKVGVGF